MSTLQEQSSDTLICLVVEQNPFYSLQEERVLLPDLGGSQNHRKAKETDFRLSSRSDSQNRTSNWPTREVDGSARMRELEMQGDAGSCCEQLRQSPAGETEASQPRVFSAESSSQPKSSLGASNLSKPY